MRYKIKYVVGYASTILEHDCGLRTIKYYLLRAEVNPKYTASHINECISLARGETYVFKYNLGKQLHVTRIA